MMEELYYRILSLKTSSLWRHLLFREKETKDLLDFIDQFLIYQKPQIYTLIGESGLGKTSLIKNVIYSNLYMKSISFVNKDEINYEDEIQPYNEKCLVVIDNVDTNEYLDIINYFRNKNCSMLIVLRDIPSTLADKSISECFNTHVCNFKEYTLDQTREIMKDMYSSSLLNDENTRILYEKCSGNFADMLNLLEFSVCYALQQNCDKLSRKLIDESMTRIVQTRDV